MTSVISNSRLHLGDQLREAAAAITARPSRSALTALGVALGVGSFVAILGLAGTATSEVNSQFDALAATTVTITDDRSDSAKPFPFPDDVDKRVLQLNGVDAGGLMWTIPVGEREIVSSPLTSASQRSQPVVVAASAGLWEAVGAKVQAGRLFGVGHDARADRVVVLGAGAATVLGVSNLATGPSILIGDHPYLVAGIIDDVRREPSLLLSVIMPRGTAIETFGEPSPKDRAQVIVSTEIGAATQVAGELALALSPTFPDTLSVTPPPDPRSLRTSVNTDLNSLFISLAAVCLFIGAVGIANTTLVAVMERTREIGLRRALGARRRHIAGQVLTESAAIGAFGGLVGTVVGLAVVIFTSLLRDWTPILSPWVIIGAPLAGLVTGALAGLYPAIRASSIEPTEALRR